MERGGCGLPSFRIDSTYLEAAASPLKGVFPVVSAARKAG